MAVATHLKTLTSKHSHLDKQIEQEMKSPIPDTIRLQTLKKQKLQLKEQIRSFQSTG